MESLSSYTRSLLKVEVPVIVTLAHKKKLVSEITGLRPGTIIQFDKSCDEMLDLQVGNYPLAVGEAVKVGDKFGIRIASIVMPDERFKSLVKTGNGTEEKTVGPQCDGPPPADL